MLAPHERPVVHAFPDVDNIQARKRHIVWARPFDKIAQGTVDHKPGKAARYLAAEVETLDPYLIVCFQAGVSLIAQQMPTQEAAAELREQAGSKGVGVVQRDTVVISGDCFRGKPAYRRSSRYDPKQRRVIKE